MRGGKRRKLLESGNFPCTACLYSVRGIIIWQEDSGSLHKRLSFILYSFLHTSTSVYEGIQVLSHRGAFFMALPVGFRVTVYAYHIIAFEK